MLEYVQEGLCQCFGQRDALERLYFVEPEGKKLQKLAGKDPLFAIREKFYWPLDAVRNQLETEFGAEKDLRVFIDATYEDTTHSLLIVEDRHVLLHYSSKPWKQLWSDALGMQKELREWYWLARGRYLDFLGTESNLSGEKLYMVDFEFISGEFRQPFLHVFEAKNSKELEIKVESYLRDYYEGEARRDGKTWFYLDDQVAVKLHGWQEIKDPQQVLSRLRV